MLFKYQHLIILFLFVFRLPFINAQEIVELPITQTDESIQWENPEKSFYSDIWQTQVVSNVSKPTMEVFRPESPNGTAVVICPGGGLYGLSINSEGNEVAQWLNKKGVTAFVLKYRLVPTGEDATKDIMADGSRVLIKAGNVLPLAISDGLNAIQHVRENAEKYKIDKNRIGMMGFSAGGAVTMGVTFNYDPINKPNFIAPVYAWMDVIPQAETPKDAPILFAVCATDDPLMLAPASVKLYSEWIKAGKSAELHMYSKGGHGFGMRVQNLPSDQWIVRFGEWLEVQGLMAD